MRQEEADIKAISEDEYDLLSLWIVISLFHQNIRFLDMENKCTNSIIIIRKCLFLGNGYYQEKMKFLLLEHNLWALVIGATSYKDDPIRVPS